MACFISYVTKKTESVKEERLKAFEADLQEKVKTQLEWHIKDVEERSPELLKRLKDLAWKRMKYWNE